MSDKLRAAVEVLLEELEGQQKQIAETKSTINALLRRMGEPSMFEEAQTSSGLTFKVRADEYYTKPVATAVSMFLKRRGQPATPQEILSGLEQGGFDFKGLGWKEGDRLRILSSSIAKNTKSFHKLPNGNVFGLVDWYDLKPGKDEDDGPTSITKPGKTAIADEIPAIEGKTNGQEKSA